MTQYVVQVKAYCTCHMIDMIDIVYMAGKE
jgi:hypothetical protein